MKSARPQDLETSAADTANCNSNPDMFPETLPAVVAARWPTKGTRADEATATALAQRQGRGHG